MASPGLMGGGMSGASSLGLGVGAGGSAMPLPHGALPQAHIMMAGDMPMPIRPDSGSYGTPGGTGTMGNPNGNFPVSIGGGTGNMGVGNPGNFRLPDGGGTASGAGAGGGGGSTLPKAHIMTPGTTTATTATGGPGGGLIPPGNSGATMAPGSTNDAPIPPGTPQVGPGGFFNPSTGQLAPAIGTPTGYNLGQGIDTSTQAFMPSGFNAGTFQNIPLQETTPPSAQTYINSLQGQAAGPTNWSVTPDQTTSGEFATLMSKGNPAIQAAEEATMRANAASGGRNSLMAQNAATLAGSQVAMSMAAQDAAVHAQAAQFNASAANTFNAQMNQYVASMTSSQQAFDQGYAQLKNQFNVNMGTMYAQVLQGAAAASENVKQTLDTTSISVNATLEQMDKTFAQNVAETGMQNQFANENAWTNFGMQVRSSYLASLNQQQTSLMQTIAAINANQNINATQAAAGIQSAVSQFNSFMSMNNAYYQSLVPGTDAATYQAYNPTSWPNN